MSLNVNCLRKKRGEPALGTFIAKPAGQPDICILVGTHLLEHETENFVLAAEKEGALRLPRNRGFPSMWRSANRGEN